MSVVKLSWSGGKNSTWSVIEHLKVSDYLKIVFYIPYFKDDIPLILPSHYDFILRTAEYFTSLGCELYQARGISYFDYVSRVVKRGENKGKVYGFPICIRGMCGFKRDSKLVALKSVDVGFYDYEDIGICFDEFHRYNQLNSSKRSILVEKQIVDSETYWNCLESSLLSPVYFYKFKKRSLGRDGCCLCSNASALEVKAWLDAYPSVLSDLIYLQDLVKVSRPDHSPYPNGRYFINL